jgi:hypothetical protein
MKKIELTQGQVALVDDQDYEELSQFKWHASWSARRHGYNAQRDIRLPDGKWTTEHMHRRILGLARGDKRHGDRINFSTLDNRRENLRIADALQSQAHRRKNRTGKSGFKGVSWYKPCQKWVVQVMRNGKRFSTYCDNKQLAHGIYCLIGPTLHGRFFHP